VAVIDALLLTKGKGSVAVSIVNGASSAASARLGLANQMKDSSPSWHRSLNIPWMSGGSASLNLPSGSDIRLPRQMLFK